MKRDLTMMSNSSVKGMRLFIVDHWDTSRKVRQLYNLSVYNSDSMLNSAYVHGNDVVPCASEKRIKQLRLMLTIAGQPLFLRSET